jgi:hypothetical protein
VPAFMRWFLINEIKNSNVFTLIFETENFDSETFVVRLVLPWFKMKMLLVLELLSLLILPLLTSLILEI